MTTTTTTATGTFEVLTAGEDAYREAEGEARLTHAINQAQPEDGVVFAKKTIG